VLLQSDSAHRDSVPTLCCVVVLHSALTYVSCVYSEIALTLLKIVLLDRVLT